MENRFDVAVAGLGAAGSSALYHLSRRSLRAVGFDAWSPPHAQGSSWGETRMIREAYYEGTRYVPLLRRAYQLWHELAAEMSETLIVETGGVFAGPPGGELIGGIETSARAHDVPIRKLSRTECAHKFPWLRVPSDMETVTEPRAGFLFPEKCIAALLRGATARGARLQCDEPVRAWHADTNEVVIQTGRGEYRARSLVLATGAWMAATLNELGIDTTVTRQPLFWFDARDPRRAPATVYAIELFGSRLLYGFPDVGTGFKTAIHYGGEPADPSTIERDTSDEDALALEQEMNVYLPGVMGARARGSVCIYTNTPDLHFVIDRHPGHANVLALSACSGHGFKFMSAIGEAAAQWIVDGAPALDLSFFAMRRFS